MAVTYVNGDISTSDNVSTVTGVSWTGLGHAAGDVAFSIWALLTTATGVVQDTGLTTIEDHTDQNLRSFFSKRTMTGSESGTVSYVVDAGSLNRMAVSLVIYRNVDTIGTAVRVTEGGTAFDKHPFGASYANQLTITPTADNALILLVYSERSSTGNTAGTLTPPTHVGTGNPSTIRKEKGTGNSGGTYTCFAEFQLGAGTAGVAQIFTQWDATPDTLVASNADMWLVALYPLATSTTVNPTGIASGEAWGTPGAALVLTVSPSSIASGEAWGTPALTLNLTASPTGIASGEAWGTPGLTFALTVSPTGIPSGEAWGTPGVSATLTASPTGIPSAEAWGTPGISGLLLSPTGIPSGEAWGTPAVQTTLTAAPTGIPSAVAFGVPGATLSLQVSPIGIASGVAWGVPGVAASLTVSPTGITSRESWGVPAVSIAQSAGPFGIASSVAWGNPTVGLSLVVAPTGIPTGEAWGAPTVTSAAPAVQRNITLTGVLEPNRFAGGIEPGRWSGEIEPNRLSGVILWPDQ